MNDIFIGVICRVPPNTEMGNLAAALDAMVEREQPGPDNNYNGVYESVGLAGLSLRMPVFTLGEILVMDDSGREIGGVGRKPSKWDVECREFDSLEEAVEFARSLS